MTTVISPVSTFACITFSGSQVHDFLQGQFTCDVSKVNDGDIQLTAYCNERARVTATGYLMRDKEQFHFFTPKNLLAHTQQKFKQYGIFSDIKIEQNHQMGMLAYIGSPQSDFPTDRYAATIINSDVRLACLNSDAELYCYFGEKMALATLQETLIFFYLYVVFVDLHFWEKANIQAGIVHVYASTLEKLTPHMINYHKNDALSFEKGCFLGQEVIARTQHRGRSKRKLYQCTIPSSSDIMLGGTLIAKDETAGLVVAECAQAETGTKALVVVSDHAVKSKLMLDKHEVIELAPVEEALVNA